MVEPARESVVDLRSDTVTRPTPAMRAAMLDAAVGDDVYGEDPTVAALEAQVAALLGHEAALFTPSGSMANQIALQLLVPPGEELLCDPGAHIATHELGAAAAYGGISTRTWAAADGLDVDAVTALIRPDGYFGIRTRAIAVEQTHNRHGAVIALPVLRRLRDAARGVALHCDGARLWHAAVADGVPVAEYGRLFDTVSVCLSKGLGAPVGSLVVSCAERIAAARLLRKRMGGGMRQAGILAAGGQYALRHHVARLADDHARARRLGEALAGTGVVDPATVRTNIVAVDLAAAPMDAPALAAAARDHGVLVSVLGPRTARLVTHLDVTDDGVEHAAAVVRKLLT